MPHRDPLATSVARCDRLRERIVSTTGKLPALGPMRNVREALREQARLEKMCAAAHAVLEDEADVVAIVVRDAPRDREAPLAVDDPRARAHAVFVCAVVVALTIGLFFLQLASSVAPKAASARAVPTSTR